MLAEVKVGSTTIKGISLGGIHTTLNVPQLGAVLDCGMAPRSWVGARRLMLSHGHLDHSGALPAFLGLRALLGRSDPLPVFVHADIEDDIHALITASERLARHDIPCEIMPMRPGEEHHLENDLWVRAVETHHPVPSLGWTFFRRIRRLAERYRSLDGNQIRDLKARGVDVTCEAEFIELSYLTDTLATALDATPDVMGSRVLIVEATFLDDRATVERAEAGGHLHLDQLIERAEAITADHVVLMHFSQRYHPDEVARVVADRCPPALAEKITCLVPTGSRWPG